MKLSLTNFATVTISRSLYAVFTAAIACSCAKGDPEKGNGKKPAATDETKKAVSNPDVEIITNKGPIKVELNREKAPISVANFLSYVADKHYDGTIFHRVIMDFMIQGGGFANGEVADEEINEVSLELQRIISEIDHKEERWFELSSKLEGES